jgi:hypothetical protein
MKQPSNEELTREVNTREEFNEVEEAFCGRLRERVADAREGQEGSLEPYQEIWYRGQSDWKHALLPSLLRLPDGLEIETEIFSTYRRLSPVRHEDEWETLFEMQHHEVATRLLDWTDVRDVALFFALRDRDGYKPTIFLLSPFLLNRNRFWEGRSGSKRRNRSALPGIFPKMSEIGESYLEYLDRVRHHGPDNPRDEDDIAPIAIKPCLQEGRMVAQRGAFTLHGSCPQPLDLQERACLARIILTENAAEQIRGTIMKSWDNYRIFPDKQGLALHVRKVFDLDGRLDKHISRALGKKWEEDIRYLRDPNIRADKGSKAESRLLFSGLEGCVLGAGDYIKANDSPCPPQKTEEAKKRSSIKQMDKHKADKKEDSSAAEKHSKESAAGEVGEKKDGTRPSILERWTASAYEGESTRVCFVIGDAGSGKTNYIVEGLSHCINSRNVLWCALGKLKERQAIFGLVAASLTPLLKDPYHPQINPQTVRNLCRSGPTILVLDGLDELARTRGDGEAKRVLSNAKRELDLALGLRLIIGCRDHVYKNKVVNWAETRALGERAEIWLDSLRWRNVGNALELPPSIDDNKCFCKAVAKVPLFLSAVKALDIQPKKQQAGNIDEELQTERLAAELRYEILEKATRDEAAADGESRDEHRWLKALGRVAALMIESRKDYLSDEDLWEHPDEEQTIHRYYKSKNNSPPWPLFVRESDKEWRFVHQSIREYVLAWNLYQSLSKDACGEGFATEVSSLDFESAEVYCFVMDLMGLEREKQHHKTDKNTEDKQHEVGSDAFLGAIQTWRRGVDVEGDENAQWNNKMRNLFEAIGMIGNGCSAKVRRGAIEAALAVIEVPRIRTDLYADYTTVYNAARCLERLHPSGPESYCRTRMRLEGLDEPHLRLATYTVQGFQKRERSIGRSRKVFFHKQQEAKAEERVTELLRAGYRDVIDDKENKVSERTPREIVNTLTRALKVLLDRPELDRGQSFVATNLSLALIRWYIRNDENSTTADLSFIDNYLPKARMRSSAVYNNLLLARWRRERGSPKVYRTISGKVVTEPHLPGGPMMQALVSRNSIQLHDKSAGKHLVVEIAPESTWLLCNEDMKKFRDAYLKKKSDREYLGNLQKKIEAALLESAGSNPFERDDQEHFFRFFSGGTLPILYVDDMPYYCLRYREISPIGWNIANGSCNTLDEIGKPWSVVDRELEEELVILNPQDKNVIRYTFCENPSSKSKEMDRRLLRAIDPERKCYDPDRLIHKPFEPYATRDDGASCREYGPDSVEIRLPNRASISLKGVYININAADLGIEFDQLLEIRGLGGSVRVLDGETTSRLGTFVDADTGFVNAPIGLFFAARLDDELGRHDGGNRDGGAKNAGRDAYYPDVLFWGGRITAGGFRNAGSRYPSDGEQKARMIDRVLDSFAEDRLRLYRDEMSKEYKKAKDDKAARGLCPAARTIIQRCRKQRRATSPAEARAITVPSEDE